MGRGAAQWSTDDELDVRFYVCDAPSRAAGLRSNWSNAAEVLQLGFSHLEASYVDSDEAMVDRLHDARRARRVHQLMLAIGPAHASVLCAVFGDEPAPKKLRDRWGDELGPVVLLLAANPGAGGDVGERAEKTLHDAKAAYAKARSEA